MKKRSAKPAAGVLALLITILCLSLTGCSEIWDITESILTAAEENAENEHEEAAPEEYAKNEHEEAAPEEYAENEPEEAAPEEYAENEPEEAAPEEYAENEPEKAIPEEDAELSREEASEEVGNTQEEAAPVNDAVKEGLRFRNKKLLDQHYEKHGREMGFSSAKEYEKAAAKVPANEKAIHKIEAEDGDDVYYVEESNEFVVVSRDGYIRTYFEPDSGKKYFDRQ